MPPQCPYVLQVLPTTPWPVSAPHCSQTLSVPRHPVSIFYHICALSVPHCPCTPDLLSSLTIQNLEGTLIQRCDRHCLWALGWDLLLFLLLSGASGIPFSAVTLEHTPTAPLKENGGTSTCLLLFSVHISCRAVPPPPPFSLGLESGKVSPFCESPHMRGYARLHRTGEESGYSRSLTVAVFGHPRPLGLPVVSGDCPHNAFSLSPKALVSTKRR